MRKPAPPPSLYEDPALYEVLLRDQAEEQAGLVRWLHRRHGNGGERWLEPACGAGRLIGALAAPGRSITGYDASSRMLAYGRLRLRGTPGARLLRGDMRRFRRRGAFDLAYCLDGSFRHLMSDRDALAHLRAVAASLRPGGVYLVGLDLCEYGRSEPDEETWTASDGGVRILHVQMTLPARARARRETVLQFAARGGEVRRFAYELRSYDARQWASLIERSPFRVSAIYDLWRRPRALDGELRSATFVLEPLSACRGGARGTSARPS